MVTAPRLGLSPANKIGGAPDNKALTEYVLDNSYATSLGTGDVVQLASDGTIAVASNTADSLGVFHGVTYVDSTGRIQIQKYWPASTTSLVTPVTALVLDDPSATFFAVATSPVTLAQPGFIYPLNLSAPNANTGRSTMTINNTPSSTGTLTVGNVSNVAAVGALANGDTFTVKSSVANVATLVTIVTGMTSAQLLAAINVAGNGLLASFNASNKLVVVTTDGGNLVITDGTGTPVADGILAAAGTITANVTAGNGLVRVMKVIDASVNLLEVILDEHSYRRNGGN